MTQTTALIQSRLHPREATIHRNHLEKKQTRMLRWKLFPVDQWIGVDKNQRKHPETMDFTWILPWNIGVSCRFSHPTKKMMNQLRDNLGKWWGPLLDIPNNIGFRCLLDQGMQHQEPSRVIKNHHHVWAIPLTLQNPRSPPLPVGLPL